MFTTFIEHRGIDKYVLKRFIYKNCVYSFVSQVSPLQSHFSFVSTKFVLNRNKIQQNKMLITIIDWFKHFTWLLKFSVPFFFRSFHWIAAKFIHKPFSLLVFLFQTAWTETAANRSTMSFCPCMHVNLKLFPVFLTHPFIRAHTHIHAHAFSVFITFFTHHKEQFSLISIYGAVENSVSCLTTLQHTHRAWGSNPQQPPNRLSNYLLLSCYCHAKHKTIGIPSSVATFCSKMYVCICCDPPGIAGVVLFSNVFKIIG